MQAEESIEWTAELVKDDKKFQDLVLNWLNGFMITFTHNL